MPSAMELLGAQNQAWLGLVPTLENGRLRLTVYDNGAGLPDDWQLKGSAGIGLANTAARLQQLYDDDHEFDIRNRHAGGVEVVIVIPLGRKAERVVGQDLQDVFRIDMSIVEIL